MAKSIKLITLAIVLALSAWATAAVFMGFYLMSDDDAASVPAKHQFDFWLGEWDLTWPGEQSGLPAGQMGRGTNSITAILDSAVIQESFVDLAPNSLRGISVSVYNQRLGKWQQTWVDNQSSYLDFVGEFKDGKMIFSRKAMTKDGKEIIQRMVWHNIAKKQLDWNWEASEDGGKTWKVNWQIHYARKK
ncbi:MAG: hypothetical protein ACRENG_05545 [bacterium]